MLELLIIFSVLFAATHIVPCHGSIRRGLVEKFGELGYRGVYTLVSFLTLGPAIYIYATNRGMGPLLWETPGWLYPLVYLLVLLAFLLLALMLANPSPTGMMPTSLEPRGVIRVTRHPMNMGVSAFSLAHIIANSALGDVFFFGSLFVVGFAGAYHQDWRKAKEKGESFVAFREQTSVLPFAALIRGRTKLELSEFSLPLIIIAIIGFLAFIFLHEKLFGAAPY